MDESTSKEKILIQTQHLSLASYSICGKVYNIVHCIKEDIPVHSERVFQFWKDANMQIDAMEKAIDNNSAFKLVSDAGEIKCFFYGIPQDKKHICGMSFWCELKRYAAVGYMFIRDRTFYSHIFWSPHEAGKIMPLAYLLDNRIITDYRHGSEYVSIRIPSTKMEELLWRERAKCQIHEV